MWYDIRGSYLHKNTEKQILINKIFSLLHCMYQISSDIQLANCYHVNLNNQSGEITSWCIKQCVLSFYFVVFVFLIILLFVPFINSSSKKKKDDEANLKAILQHDILRLESYIKM